MKKYFSEYIAAMLLALEDDNSDFEKLKREMLVKIQFMQHERLIHFMVTILFALLMFMSLIGFFVSENLGMLAAAVLMLILLVPYIAHYYFLENGVQKLYGIYDKICEKADVVKTSDKS
ncbi:MAG: hypothetical protein HDT25_05725 [Ruminococcus sp.]|nr:hypothetical protein [Ruminococcus sp.]